MQVISRFLCLSALAAGPALAATNVAVIDSGVDYKHKDLAANMWKNPGETAGNSRDDDGNGYVDDVQGWNFGDKNNQVIDYKYLGTFPADCNKFFEMQGKILTGTATAEDKAWYDAHKADAEFIKKLNIFGNFVHGSHVSGIASKGNADARIVAIKLIPTEPPAAPGGTPEDGNDFLIPIYLKMAAGQQATMLTDTAKYADKAGAKVANGSFGASLHSVEPAIAPLLKQLLGRDPTAEESHKWALYLLNEMVTASKAFVDAAPRTLFVFAAGNDGTNNDETPASPANVKADNVITVAATLGTESLASFSNTGVKMVEVAAPGVIIDSTIPGDQHLPMSGTSMAAPFVTNAAALVSGANPALTPVQVKKVLMDTVDVKDFLAGKVKTSGIVNQRRAAKAAALSLTMSLDDAISEAHRVVADLQDTYVSPRDDKDLFVLPLPTGLSL